MYSLRGKHLQRGAGLVEALIALLVLSVGLVGMTRLQAQLRLNADLARQRSEAVRLAQEDMENVRAFSTMTPSPSGRSYAQVASGSSTIGPANGYASNTSYTLARSVVDATDYRSAKVSVRWTDRSGGVQQVELNSAIAAVPPAFSGALIAQAAAQPLKRVRGRSAFIPLVAKDLHNGTSVLRPTTSSTIAFVLDNATGAVLQRCTVAATASTDQLAAGDLTECTAGAGMLLSGVVRLSRATPPDPAHANDPPLPLEMRLTLSGSPSGTPPLCASEAQASGAERFVAYHCVVTPVAGGWSGHSSVLPQGWRIGLDAGSYRVCRYSADQDGSGAIDSNAEHPSEYSHVNETLMQQNFLIVRGDQSCPGPFLPDVGSGAVAATDFSTVQHQP